MPSVFVFPVSLVHVLVLILIPSNFVPSDFGVASLKVSVNFLAKIDFVGDLEEGEHAVEDVVPLSVERVTVGLPLLSNCDFFKCLNGVSVLVVGITA